VLRVAAGAAEVVVESAAMAKAAKPIRTRRVENFILRDSE